MFSNKILLNNINDIELKRMKTLLTPKLTKFIPYTPTPKQTAFLLLQNREAFYGGSAGGGKSISLLMAALQYVDVPGYAAILFRKSYADLTKPGALMDTLREWLFPFVCDKLCAYKDKDKKWEFYNYYGRHREIISIVQFGYLEGEKDRFNYQGGEYQFIAFDELTHIAKVNYKYLFSRCRRTKKLKDANIPLRIRSASNPADDDESMWIYYRFIDPKTRLKSTAFIPAGIDDNPYLDQEGYEENLKSLDPITRLRLSKGVWLIQRKGNMFKRDWFQNITSDFLKAYRKRVRAWDLASTDVEKAKKKNKNSEPDYTVGVKMSYQDGIYIIEDIDRDRKDPAGTEQMQLNCAKLDGFGCHIREEMEPGSSGKGVIDIKRRMLLKNYKYEGEKSQTDKATRARNFSAACANGLVAILESCRNKEAFFNEAEGFPAAIHDDIIDACSLAFNFLASKPKQSIPDIPNQDEDFELEGESRFANLNGYNKLPVPK